jgi:hypothetical protein
MASVNIYSRNRQKSADVQRTFRVQPTFDSMMLLVTKVQGYTTDSAGTTVRYGTVNDCDSEGASVSVSDLWSIQARYRRAPARIDRAVQTTRHIRVSGGMFTRGMLAASYRCWGESRTNGMNIT